MGNVIESIWDDIHEGEPYISKNQLVEALDIIAKNYTWVLYKGEERRWCTNEVAEFGSSKEAAYMTDNEFASLLYLILFSSDKNDERSVARDAK